GQPDLRALPVQVGDRPVDLVGGAAPHAAAPVEDAVDGRLGQPGLAGDLADREGVRHTGDSEGFLRDRWACRATIAPVTLDGPARPAETPGEDVVMTAETATWTAPGWFGADDCRLADFRAVVETATDPADYPHADGVREGVLVYGAGLAERTATAPGRRAVQAEMARALADGPGIV